MPTGQYFVPESKLVDTLFDKKGTAAGTFKVRRARINFCDLKGDVFASLLCGKGQAGFFVSSKMMQGKLIYSNGLCSKDAERLGVSSLSYAEEISLSRDIKTEIFK